MIGNLKFDDGIIALAVNGGDRIFRFNPTDPAVYDGFMNLMSEVPEKITALAVEAEKTDDMTSEEQAKSELAQFKKADAVLRELFDGTFGAGQSDIVFGNQNAAAICKNGDYLFINALMAIYPYFEKEAKKRTKKVDDLVNAYKPKG